MNLHFSTRYVLLAVALILTVSVGALTLTGTAAAQADSGVTIDTNGTDQPQPVKGQVGPIVIEDYELQGGTFTLTVDVQESTAYALTDALDGTQSGGVTELPVKQGALREGRQTLSINVAVIDDAAAVTLSTPGEAVRIQSGMVVIGDTMIPAGTVRLLLLGTAIGAAGFTFRTVRKKREDETKDAERIL
jgi:hypothetical protein